jgi:predicted lipid-binding transport protein (Tim44 family)
MKHRVLIGVATLAVATVVAGHVSDAWARAGSGGSRGSRSYSSPSRPSSPASPTTPTSPSRSVNQPASPAAPMQRPSFMQRFGGAIAGFALGGLLGGLLFGGLGGGFGGGGIGMFDILLVVGGIALLMYFLRSRRQQADQPAYATAGASSYGAANTGAGGTAVLEMPAAGVSHGELAEGIAHIRQMDPAFESSALAEWVRAQFGSIQAAVAMRDVGMIRDRLAPEMYGVLLTQCEELKAAKRRNYVERIDLTRVETTEAWQEKGQDFVTVYLEGSMCDYTVEEATGAVVQGSKTEPSRVEEFWTFTRPVGPNKWKLTAIQSA